MQEYLFNLPFPNHRRAHLHSSQLTSSIKENPRLRAAAEELKNTGVKVGDAVSEALKTMEESEIMRAVCELLILPFRHFIHPYPLRYHVQPAPFPVPLPTRLNLSAIQLHTSL